MKDLTPETIAKAVTMAKKEGFFSVALMKEHFGEYPALKLSMNVLATIEGERPNDPHGLCNYVNGSFYLPEPINK